MRSDYAGYQGSGGRKYIKIFSKYGRSDEWEKAVRKSIVDAADTSILFSRSRTGALLVFERETMLSDIASTGTIIDAETSVALFGNIFFFSPMQLGAREGGFALSVSALSISGAYGVYTSLITRVREVIWIIIGLALMKIGNKRNAP